MSSACGAQSVSSIDAPLSSRSVIERFDVSPPSRFMIVLSSPTWCTTAQTSTREPLLMWSTSAIFLKA